MSMMILMVMFLIGLLKFFTVIKNFFMMLLTLEYVALILFMFMILVSAIGGDIYMGLVYLVFLVCESSIGVSLLVSFIRSFGNDFYSTFTGLEW
uniref:NADH-ubiquinone oxidoreductase chain 4L n=1 Tax=Zorotypus medoensis TaxID=1264643 RepID=A0A0A7C392_9NEOP|nr:NADH dehydrogenase subunit 4L [Zorotypus medoensis]AHY35149.1 NADH dehydrogenase subunit 4L [Zorotypus medoensis]